MPTSTAAMTRDEMLKKKRAPGNSAANATKMPTSIITMRVAGAGLKAERGDDQRGYHRDPADERGELEATHLGLDLAAEDVEEDERDAATRTRAC